MRTVFTAWISGLKLLFICLLGTSPLFISGVHAADDPMHTWFENFKQTATPKQMQQFLHAMPKGGDLHNHLTGSIHPEWLWDLALQAEERGYLYYTKVRINNCRFGSNEYGGNAYLLLFKNLMEYEWQQLSDCEKSEYKLLQDLTDEEQTAWLDSLRLDQTHEGRAEFFEAHWPRIGSLLNNPYLVAEGIYLNMKAFGEEGARYLEAQIPVWIGRKPDGTAIMPAEVAEIYRARANEPDAKATGMTVRFQVSVLRFLPNAEEFLRMSYKFVHDNEEFVAVNMVGREDNDKGYPLRFLDTYRDLRRDLPGVKLSIHAGEVDEPNAHVRDTLLLGADRIGHGVNLITDPDTMLLMRHGPYLVEINLVSNLLLEYVSDYADHPFPEYLRTSIPVALSTDDRGMWDSTLTDEFYVAVTEFNLSWDELKTLHTNSIQYAFVEASEKQRMLADLAGDLKKFERRMLRGGVEALKDVKPQHRGFLCRQYELCGE